MKIEFELYQLLMLGAMILGAFYGMAKMLLAQSKSAIDEKFDAISRHMVSQDAAGRQLERDLLNLRAELPRDYVRREDYTQTIATIMTKIDNVALRMENLFERARKGDAS